MNQTAANISIGNSSRINLLLSQNLSNINDKNILEDDRNENSQCKENNNLRVMIDNEKVSVEVHPDKESVINPNLFDFNDQFMTLAEDIVSKLKFDEKNIIALVTSFITDTKERITKEFKKFLFEKFYDENKKKLDLPRDDVRLLARLFFKGDDDEEEEIPRDVASVPYTSSFSCI